MGSVTLFDAARMQEIEDGTVTSGFVDLDGHLLLSRRDGATIDAGDVRAPNLADASTTVKGIAQLATDAEAVSGLDDLKIITPKSLAAKVASIPPVPNATDTIPGIVELATSAETIAGTDGTRAVTPSSMSALTLGSALGTEDLDDITAPGMYHQGTNANATVARHYPYGNASGLLVVDSRTITPTFISQMLYTRQGTTGATPGRVFNRVKYSTNPWGPWLELSPTLQPKSVIPSSIVVGSGSASVASDGTITFSGCSSVSLNGVFDGLGADIYDVYCKLTHNATTGNAFVRLRKAGVDTASGYVRVAAFKYGQNGTAPQGAGGGSSEAGYIAPQGLASADAMGKITLWGPGLSGNTYTMTTSRQITSTDGSVWEDGSAGASTAHDGLTILTPTGTVSGTIKVVKIA